MAKRMINMNDSSASSPPRPPLSPPSPPASPPWPPLSPPSPPAWWGEDGSRPGWEPLAAAAASSSSVSQQHHHASWSFSITNVTSATPETLLDIGEYDYPLRLAPFNSSLGTLYFVDTTFSFSFGFYGELAPGEADGGASGSFVASAWLGYWDSINLYPPVGAPFAGFSAGNGSEAVQAEAAADGRRIVRWSLDGTSKRRFVGNLEGAVFGLTAASYEAPLQRQCDDAYCGSLAVNPLLPAGLCGIACAGGAKLMPLQQIAWRRPNGAVGGGDGRVRRRTPFTYYVGAKLASMRVDLNVSLSFTFSFKSADGVTLSPPSPPPLPRQRERWMTIGVGLTLTVGIILAACGLAVLLACRRRKMVQTRARACPRPSGAGATSSGRDGIVSSAGAARSDATTSSTTSSTTRRAAPRTKRLRLLGLFPPRDAVVSNRPIRLQEETEEHGSGL